MMSFAVLLLTDAHLAMLMNLDEMPSGETHIFRLTLEDSVSAS